eukprot:64779-Rhodomonas_salina.1
MSGEMALPGAGGTRVPGTRDLRRKLQPRLKFNKKVTYPGTISKLYFVRSSRASHQIQNHHHHQKMWS